MPAYRLLLTTDTVGGVWRYALDLARELARADVAVTLATLGPRPSPEQRREAVEVADFVETDAPLDWLCENRDDLARGAATLASLARARGVDLIQFNGAALAGLARFEVATVAMHHSCLATWWASVKGDAFPADWSWRRDLVRRHLFGVASVAAPTRAFAQATACAYDLNTEPEVIANGRPWPADSTAHPPAAALLTAGRLWDEGKDVATLDRAARRLKEPVYAAGPVQGPNGARVTLSRLTALGPLSEAEMRARLAARPVFVSSALYEPFGLAVLEAAQAGCALLLSDIPTFRELWEGAATFFPARDDAGLAEAAAHLLADPSARETLGAAARERAREYSVARSAAATLAWHRRILHREPVESAA